MGSFLKKTQFEFRFLAHHILSPGRIKSDLYYTLWEVFAKHKIEIPNPQRDVNLGDGWEKFIPDFRQDSTAYLSPGERREEDHE